MSTADNRVWYDCNICCGTEGAMYHEGTIGLREFWRCLICGPVIRWSDVENRPLRAAK